MSTGRNFFCKWRKVIDILVRLDSFLPRSINQLVFDLVSPLGGRVFIFIRYVLIRNLAAACGENVAIFKNVTIENIKKLKLGNNISVHTGCYLDAAGEIFIGNDVSIAHQSSILSANHTWEDFSLPIKYNPMETSSVHIEKDVWIGCGCRILCGVRICSRSVIAAGAVVCKNVEANTVVGGVHARAIKKI